MRRAAVVVSLFVAAGCAKREPPPLAWQPELGTCAGIEDGGRRLGSIACARVGDEEDGPRVELAIDGTDLVIWAYNFRDGTDVAAGTAQATIAQGQAMLRVPIGDRIAKLPIDKAKHDLAQPLAITMPGFSPLTTNTPSLEPQWSVLSSLAGHAGQPVAFGGDAARATAGHTIVYVEVERDASLDQLVFGPGKTFGDVDWVAVGRHGASHRVGSCTYDTTTTYNGVESRGVATVDETGVDEDVTIYERRTGKLVARQSFVAQETGCPDRLSSEHAITELADRQPIQTWLTGLVGYGVASAQQRKPVE